MLQGRFRYKVYPFSYATFRTDLARLSQLERIRLRTILVARLEEDTAHLAYCEKLYRSKQRGWNGNYGQDLKRELIPLATGALTVLAAYMDEVGQTQRNGAL